MCQCMSCREIVLGTWDYRGDHLLRAGWIRFLPRPGDAAASAAGAIGFRTGPKGPFPSLEIKERAALDGAEMEESDARSGPLRVSALRGTSAKCLSEPSRPQGYHDLRFLVIFKCRA